MFAVLRPDPPNTLIVRTSRAPELSATLNVFLVGSLVKPPLSLILY